MTREELELRKLVRESDVIDKTDGSELAKAFNHLWEKYIEQEPEDAPPEYRKSDIEQLKKAIKECLWKLSDGCTYLDITRNEVETAILKLIDAWVSESGENKFKAKSDECNTCYHNETEFSICQYCTGGDKYEERYCDK